MRPSPEPELADRFVRIRASLGDSPDTGVQRLSSGFIVREGVVLTSAHSVAGARWITVSDLRDRRWVVGPDEVVHGDPRGPGVGMAPDLALLSVAAAGAGMRPFPVARLNRPSRQLTTLSDVHVWGFPYFREQDDGRRSFSSSGTVDLASQTETGLIDVQLPGAPRDLDARREAASQWSGISGAPVIVEGHLVAVVTEHSPRTGPALLVATPLTVIDPHPGWPRWGPGMAEPGRWWARLGVTRASGPVNLPDDVRASWIDDLRALAGELAIRDPRPRLHQPVHFAVQAHDAFLAVLRELPQADYEEAARLLPQAVARPERDGAGSVYGLTVRDPLTSGVLTAALEDLLAVHAVADARLPPDALARLRYRLFAPRVGGDVDADVEGWVHRADDAVLARDLVTRLTITTGEDSYGELLACLSNAEWTTADPLATAQALVASLLSDQSPAPRLADTLRDCFRGESSPAAILLTGADTEPPTVEREKDGFLVNEQPTLAHLRRGDFAPAQDLDSVEEAYWSWYEREISGGGRRRTGAVPTFWLTGPSGAGKSVLLLQLLARLNSRAGVSVLWCGGAGERLAEVVEQATAHSRTRHVVVGVDDPLAFRGGGQGLRAAFDALARRRQTDAPAVLPVFVCCAPTEQYGRFRQEYAGDALTEQYVIDPYRPEFTAHLRTWYEQRTGRPTQTSAADGTPLPAQLFFEWWKGVGVSAFAHRFRERIEATALPELVDFFDRLLAVNRLYVGYPSDAVRELPPQARDALAVFQHDMHVHQPAVNRPGYWLSHPHLANVIYQEWYPEARHHDVRAAHLTAALMDAVRVDQEGLAGLALLEQLFVELGTDAADNSRTDAAQVRAALATASAEVGPGAAGLAPVVLASWVKIARRDPRSVVGWDPLPVALDRLATLSETELRPSPLIRTLAELGTPETDEALWDFLAAHPDLKAWVPTAQLMIGRLPPTAPMDVLIDVVRDHRDDADAIGLLAAALRRRPAGIEALRTVAHELVEGTMATTAALGPLAAALFTLPGASRRTALAWLDAEVRQDNGAVFLEVLDEKVHDTVAWNALGRWLLEYPFEEAADIGFARMARIGARVADDRFRRALGRHLRQSGQATSPELLEVLRQLLSGQRTVWPFVFTTLAPAQIRTPEIREAAVRWLTRNPDSTAWSRVFGHMCQAVSVPDRELYLIGMGQLPYVWESRHTSGIVACVLQCCAPEDRAETARTALRWLDEHQDEADAWCHLASAAIRATSAEDMDAATGQVFAWWSGHRDDRWSSYVIRAVLTAPVPEGMRGEVVAQVEDWLGEPRVGWGHVFLDLVPLIDQERAVGIATAWLDRDDAAEDVRWPAVFARVVAWLDAGRIAEITRGWFGRPTLVDSTAGFMWHLALESGPCRELLYDDGFRQVVHGWLRDHGLLASWWHIWREMHNSRPDDTETMRVALETTVALDRSNGIANMLRKTITARPDLADAVWAVMATCERGVTWQLTYLYLLPVAPTEVGWELGLASLPRLPAEYFSSWWRRMWKAFPERRKELRPLALAWLADAPGEAGHKVRAVLEEYEARRITPASVFGRPRSGGPLPGPPPRMGSPR